MSKEKKMVRVFRMLIRGQMSMKTNFLFQSGKGELRTNQDNA